MAESKLKEIADLFEKANPSDLDKMIIAAYEICRYDGLIANNRARAEMNKENDGDDDEMYMDSGPSFVDLEEEHRLLLKDRQFHLNTLISLYPSE